MDTNGRLAALGYGGGFWRWECEHGDGFDDVEASAAKELVNDRLVQAAGVEFDADSLFGLVDGEAADTIDLADLSHGQSGGLGRRRSVAIQNIKLGHGSMIPARPAGEGLARLP